MITRRFGSGILSRRYGLNCADQFGRGHKGDQRSQKAVKGRLIPGTTDHSQCEELPPHSNRQALGGDVSRQAP